MKTSGLQVGDTVKLEHKWASMLYDGEQYDKEQYREIHQNNLTGEVTNLNLQDNHYCYGEYAIVKWQNGFTSETIHTSWLVKHIKALNS
jgi:hypothetical protein